MGSNPAGITRGFCEFGVPVRAAVAECSTVAPRPIFGDSEPVAKLVFEVWKEIESGMTLLPAATPGRWGTATDSS
jgi:hypothetical protein